jgi:hypothetical protein
VFALIGLSLLLSGCSLAGFVPEHQEAPPKAVALVVDITGTPGTAFEGSLGTTAATRSITGQVPAQYSVDGIAVVVSLTKTGEAGNLTVRVLRSGQEVARRTTDAPYGSLLLVYKP